MREGTQPTTDTGSFCTLGEPIHDRLLAMLLQVASELWVTRDRLRLLEETLADAGVPVTRLEEIAADPERWDHAEPERDALIARIVAPLTQGASSDAMAELG